MKKFNFIKKLLTVSLSIAFVVTGVLSVALLNDKKVLAEELEAYEVANESLSKDIQDIITELKKSTHVKAAYYVSEKPVNGSDGAAHGNVSGIKVVFDGGDNTFSILENLNVTSLTYKDNTFGFLFDEYVDTSSFYIGLKDITANVTNLIKIDQNTGETVSNPKMNLQFRQVVGSAWKTAENIYHWSDGYGKIQVYTTSNDTGKKDENNNIIFEPKGPSRKSLNNVSFDFMYDNASNALYGDTEFSHKLIKFLNVAPSEYSNYDLKTKSAGTKAVNSTFTESGQLFAGYTNNQAAVTVRKFTDNTSIVITSLAGLDLTSATNTYSATTGAFSIADKDVVTNGTELYTKQAGVIPKASMVHPVTYNKVADATNYTVNVYSGTRSSKQGVYGSNGYAYATLADDPNLTIVENNVNLDTFAFATVGAYTLEYVSSEGDVFYVDINAKPISSTLNLTTLNASILDAEGNILNSGDIVQNGQTLTVVPSEGYTLFSFELSSVPQVKFGKNYVDLVKSGDDYTCVVDTDYAIDGALNAVVAAYECKYTLTLIKDAATNDKRELTLYKGISSYWYDIDNWTNRTRGTYYNALHYNGEKLGVFGWPWGSIGDAVHCVMDGKTCLYKTAGSGDYDGTTGETKGNFNTNAFEITGDATLKPYFLYSYVSADKAFINAEGAVGLGIEVGIEKSGYEALKAVYDDKTYTYFNVKAVVTTEKYLIESKIQQDPYRIYMNGDKNKIVSVDLTENFANSSWVKLNTAGDYYTFNIVLYNIPMELYDDNLVFGAYVAPTTNGGWFKSFGSRGADGKDTKCVPTNMLDASTNAFNDIAQTDVRETENRVTLGGVTFYAKQEVEDTWSSNQNNVSLKEYLTMVVKYYYRGLYVKHVQEEQTTEGWTPTEGWKKASFNGRVYYYDSAKTDLVERIITIALDEVCTEFKDLPVEE